MKILFFEKSIININIGFLMIHSQRVCSNGFILDSSNIYVLVFLSFKIRGKITRITKYGHDYIFNIFPTFMKSVYFGITVFALNIYDNRLLSPNNYQKNY
ncbi:MAG: hypothetical protein V3575_04020 [Candidatus Absconditabacteria bacterium]